jgi:N-acetylglucosaminyldiphosphoundecaprenol N-acetyl-beta-D-mannosaminyltransferase
MAPPQAARSATSTATEFLGLQFDDLSLEATTNIILDRPSTSDFAYVVTPNVAHVVRLDQADEDDPTGEAFAHAYSDAWMVLCDSRVLARMARLSGRQLSLVPGSDLTAALLADPRIAGRRVAVVGGRRGLVETLQRRVPSATFVQHRPPMNVLDEPGAMADIEAFVTSARADLVIFAIGAPQSEIAAQRCLQSGRARGVALAAGASLEFLVGDKTRAPLWLQRAGLEWAYRLASEPRRLWRRYLLEGPRVVAIWARSRHA